MSLPLFSPLNSLPKLRENMRFVANSVRYISNPQKLVFISASSFPDKTFVHCVMSSNVHLISRFLVVALAQMYFRKIMSIVNLRL